MNEVNLVKVDALSGPAKVLINKISDAVGGLCEPWQIKRVANAKAKAEVINAKAQIKITGLHRKAFHRFLEEETKKQRNMEEITRQALPQLNDNPHPEKVENDWIMNFFDKCRLISDEEMQVLWAKVLAGEANYPGKYSKRTVNFLSSLDKSDAEFFSKLCSFSCLIKEVDTLLIYDRMHRVYTEHGLRFNILSHLASIGLIDFNYLTGFDITELEQKMHVNLGNTKILIEFPRPKNNKMKIGQVMLTQVGRELASISGSTIPVGFEEYVREQWKRLGYKIRESEENPGTPGTPA